MQKIYSLALSGFIAAVVMTHSTFGFANTQDFEALQSRASAGDVAAQRELGEALIYGTGGVAQDTVAGMELLERAAAAGDIDAQTTLGIDRLWGINSDADPEVALMLLKAAASNGSSEAARVLGQGLIGGWVLDRDVAAGTRYLEQSAESGNAQAKVTLGGFYLYGDGLPQDIARATKLFESAAKDGNGEGLEQLGGHLMWEQLDAVKGEAYLRQAGALGRTSAWETLAEGAMYGYLGPDRGDKFKEFAENARASKSSKIEVLDAKRQMWGISMRASGEGTIAKLEDAATQGNKDALKFLIGLVRDGNQMNIRKEPDRASAYIEKYSDLLTQNETAQFKLSVEAATAESRADYNAIHDRFAQWDGAVSDDLAKEIFAANPNLTIYLLQKGWKAKGAYEGDLNGLATRATLRAVVNGCKAHRIRLNCTKSVVDADIIGPLLAMQFR